MARLTTSDNSDSVSIYTIVILILMVVSIILSVIKLNNLYEPHEYTNLGDYTLQYDNVRNCSYTFVSPEYADFGKYYVTYKGSVNNIQTYYNSPYRFRYRADANEYAKNNATITVTSYKDPSDNKILVMADISIDEHIKNVRFTCYFLLAMYVFVAFTVCLSLFCFCFSY